MTGFQVLDGVMHLFVLEGLRDYGMKEIWETLPQPEDSGEDCLTLWASTRQNLSSGFQTKQVSNQSPQLQRLARKLKFQL